MAKEQKEPGKGSEKAARQRPKGVGDEKGTVRNHDSRQDNVVKKEKPSIRNHDSRQDNVVKKE
jgi:hypothetical protein